MLLGMQTLCIFTILPYYFVITVLIGKKWCLIVIFDSYHNCVSSMVSIICLYLRSKCIKMLCPFNFFCWVIRDQLTLTHAPKPFKTNIFYLSKYIVAGVCHYWAGSRTSIPSVQIFDSYGSESEKRKHSSSQLFSVVLRNKLMYTYSWGLGGNLNRITDE